MSGVTLQVLAGEFAVCRLPPDEPVPAWAGSAVFSSVTRTPDELSIICESRRLPAGQKAEGGWRLVKLVGPFDFGAVGILASVAVPLARAGISLLTVGTFDTDYVLVKGDHLEAAVHALASAGHLVQGGRGKPDAA